MLRYLLFFLLFFTSELYSQRVNWQTDSGWVYKVDNKNNSSHKYFAIGVWGIPDYKYVQQGQKESRKNRIHFQRKTNNFNSVYIQNMFIRDYMVNKTIFVGSSEFNWAFGKFAERNYSEKGLSNTNKRNLVRDINKNNLNIEIDNIINSIYSNLSPNKWDVIWAPIDEVDSWPPELMNFVYKKIKQKTVNSLIYVNLTGSGRNNSYSRANIARPEFSNNKVVFFEQWHKNIETISNEYRHSGDVFGINSYTDFFNYPKLAGTTVDAIKLGAGKDVPVWLFFDPMGYAKPNNITLNDYIVNVKCQVYTSIIFGATGALFWCDIDKGIRNYDAFLPLIIELKKNENIITSKTIQKRTDDELHFIIKENSKGERFIIASNTSKSTSALITTPVYKILKPLEVYIAQIK